LLPLVVGVTTVLGTFLALSGIDEVYGLNVFALNLVIGLGLGLSIDYTLFLLTRYREELARQGATPEAIRTTLRTAGRTVASTAAKAPVLVAVTAPASARADVAAYARRVTTLDGVERVGPPRFLGGRTWQLDVVAAGDSAGPVAQRVVQEVRDLPASFDARV